MAELRPSSIGYENGRTTIDDSRRKKWSKRAQEGKLEVVLKTCPKCGHHKMFNTAMKQTCCKCRWTKWN